jgi:dolichyl-diphosphooligosaccharide--protein glycosyltransferase
LLQAFGVFGLSQIIAFVDFLKSKLSQENFEILFHALFTTFGIIVAAGATVLWLTGEA